jgi:hypothetical protein
LNCSIFSLLLLRKRHETPLWQGQKNLPLISLWLVITFFFQNT